MTHEERRRRARRIVRELKRLIPVSRIALDFRTPWQLLIATILAAQCTDKKVNEVTRALFRKYRTLDDYVRADPREFERDIHATGFFRAKTRHILRTAQIVKERFGGKVPRTMTELLTLPGVARKTANVVLGNAFGVVEGIAVDTHVRRLSRLHGLTAETDPVKIERDLTALIPRAEWLDFNHRLVLYGRRFCPARPHDHARCPLAELLQ